MATKKSKTTKSTGNKETKQEQTKKPLVSTARKIGIAVYFTFLGTLALAFGVSIWMADVFNDPTTITPNKGNEYTQNQEINTPNETTANGTIDQNAQQPNTPTPTQNYDNSANNPNLTNNDTTIQNYDNTAQETQQNQINQQQYDLYCPNENCDQIMKISL